MKKLTIVMYHYVRPIKNSSYQQIKGLELEGFIRQLDYLNKNYKFITVESLVDTIKNESHLPDNPCLLTFDDGYKDHYEYVFPELKKRGIQGSFFPSVKPIEKKEILNVNKIHFILAKQLDTDIIIKDIKKLFNEYKNKPNNYKLDEFENYWKKYAVEDKFRTNTKNIMFIKRVLQLGLPESIRNKFCDHLFQQYVTSDQKAFASKLYMSEEELKEMIKSGMYIGSHGYQHLWLNTVEKKIQNEEIEKSLNFLKKIGAPTSDWVMCYPYGAYNSDTLEILKKKGCVIGLTTNVGLATLRKGFSFELSRFDTNDFPQYLN